jgi:hypothetical protein
MPKVTIHVEQRHIDNGDHWYGDRCMAALAIREQTPFKDAIVGVVGFFTNGYKTLHLLPKEITPKITAAIRHEQARRGKVALPNSDLPEPFSFELEIP